MGYRIAVYDKDSAYLWKLMSYLNERENERLCVYGYTDKSSLIEGMELYSVDMILAGMDMDCSGLKIPLLYMGEDKDICRKLGYIYKYQSMENILPQLYSFAGNNRKIKYGKTRLICVFSPLGRCGKTTLARNLAWHMGSSIYFGMEDYLPLGDFDWEEQLSYYLLSKDLRLLDYIDRLPLNEREISYMYLTDTYQDSADISFDNLNWLISEIKNRRELNGIIFDIGQCSLGDWRIFSLFDSVIVPCLKDEVSIKKLEYFKKILEQRSTREVINKMKYIYTEELDSGNIGEIL